MLTKEDYFIEALLIAEQMTKTRIEYLFANIPAPSDSFWKIVRSFLPPGFDWPDYPAFPARYFKKHYYKILKAIHRQEVNMGSIAAEKRQPLIDTIIAICRKHNYKVGHLKGNKPSEFWSQVISALPTDEITWSTGVGYYRNVWPDIQQDVLNILKADKQTISTASTQITTVQTEEPERSEQVKKPICSEDIPIQTIEQIVEKIIDKRLLELKEGLLTKQYGLELAPLRAFIKGKRGKQENRKPRDIATSLDKELYKRFQADRQRYGVSESFMLDTILWHFYQKPKLSYELDPLRIEPDED